MIFEFFSYFLFIAIVLIMFTFVFPSRKAFGLCARTQIIWTIFLLVCFSKFFCYKSFGGNGVREKGSTYGEDEVIARIKENFRSAASPVKGELHVRLQEFGAMLNPNDATAKELIVARGWTHQDAESILGAQRSDGTWPDVDYETHSMSAWPAVRHLDHLRALAKLERTKEVEKALHIGLSSWLRRDFIHPNWWWNKIGVPLALGSAALAMDDVLSDGERSEIARRLSESNIAMTGQNRVWLSECVLMRGLLSGNIQDVAAARDAIASELHISDDEEGIQDDWSFHQHGNMAQFGNYGATFILSISRLVRAFDGTALEIPQERRSVLSNLVSRGFLPIVWKGSMDVGNLGRQLIPASSRIKGCAVLVAAQRLGISAMPKKGLFWFPRSACGVYRSDGWMASIKCETKTIIGGESINGENLLGAQMANGALFCYATGDEYRDIFPIWNWCHIPGTTSYETDIVDWSIRNVSEMCEAQDGEVRFTLNRGGLEAQTTWRFSDAGVDVSVDGITSTNKLPVVTTVEQSLAQANASWTTEGDRIIAVNGAFRYEVPTNAIVKIEDRKGSWQRHMANGPEGEVGGKVFEIVIPHGISPRSKSCSWSVRPVR